MSRSSGPSHPRRGVSVANALAAARQRHKARAIDNDCSCFTGQKPISINNDGSKSNISSRPQSLLHMDECDDPHCVDLEQLKQLQTSLDHFTDYEHYERCCDEGGRHHHHCSHGAVVEDVECCDAKTRDDCQGGEESTLTPNCDDCCEDCDECASAHDGCYEEVDVCEEDCEQCEEECEEMGHDREDCPQDHPTTRDNCLEAYTVPLPLLGPTNDFDLQSYSTIIPDLTPCTDDCIIPSGGLESVPDTTMEPAFDTAMDHWQTFVQGHHCAPDPCILGQVRQLNPPQHIDPAFGFSFSCDPTNPANQYPWQTNLPHCAIPMPPAPVDITMGMPMDVDSGAPQAKPRPSTPSLSSQASMPSSLPATPATAVQERVCQWVMPCGSICGANFNRTEDLKKHVKNSHGVKGTVSCGWKDCSSSFASEAALTGHISKKHLAFDEEGPWKCTFPDCTKSFMYKQVRDEHVASHNGGNKMHCPICHQWLNAEGSNFRRHMASHGPKTEHMKCKYEHLGCKKRFPRVDNLRRHEACCKIGKKAHGVHHHHHKVHLH